MIGYAFLLALFIHIIEPVLLQWVDPQTRQTLTEIGKAMQTHGSVGYTLMAATIVGVTAGVGEETLFRGLIQPVFGIVPTALLFALIHIHYGLTVLLIELFIVGLFLGFVRYRWNTTAAIIVHAGFDFFAILSSLLS
jgi:membrane protease YdiL (CAAX protease family)